MIPIRPPEGMKQYSRVTYYNAFQFFEDEWRRGRHAERFQIVRAIDDIDPHTGSSWKDDECGNRVCVYAFFITDLNGESWRLNNGDWIISDAMNPANVIKMTNEEFRAADFADDSIVWFPQPVPTERITFHRIQIKGGEEGDGNSKG